jgi:hypothetical protein
MTSIAGEHLERKKSWNDRKSETTGMIGKPELHDKPEQEERSLFIKMKER